MATNTLHGNDPDASLEMMQIDPFNISIMNVEDYISKHRLEEVTSSFIHVPSSQQYDPDGLFSERIFGEMASQMRLIKLGYISLNCRVFHPVIFQNIMALKRFYVEIMSGRSYAKWDPETCDFIRASETEDGANTGYSFFLKHFDKIEFNKNNSLKHNDKINVILKYKNRLMIRHCLVCPAGIRDIKDEDGRVEKDSINSLYISLLERARAMPKGSDTDPIYDSIHYAIQRKVLEIYEYLLEFVRGKRGFFESKFGARSVAQGTRNVITSTSMESTDPSSPQYHKLDEVKVPLYQAAKGYSSLVLYYLKTLYYSTVIQDGADQIPLIDPDTLRLQYVQISDKDRDSMLTAEGIMKTIDKFRDPEYRWRPVASTVNGKLFYMYMVYDVNNKIYVFRNLDEFKTIYKNSHKVDVDQDKIRPLTYAEMLYVATYYASRGKSGTVTRYPIADEQNIFPAKTHLMSTVPGRIVSLITNFETDESIQLPEYPSIGKDFVDAIMFHPSRRAGLNADYDGNCLVGSTIVQIRYSPIWYTIIEDLDYSISGQDKQRMLNALKRDTYVHRSGELETIYASIRMDELPQPGSFSLDKNGAKVYDLPAGCEVLTLDNGAPAWRSFEKITVEDDCEYRTIRVGGRTASVSTNPSVAVFDIETGKLKKVTPVEAEGKFAPTIIKDISPYGKIGTYMDGWFLGAMVSDGYLECKYLGYTKIDESSRRNVINYLKSIFGNDLIYKQYEESPLTGANKLARSISLHITDPRVREWACNLDMYDNDTVHNALTKRISMKHLMNGSREFLVGLFAGLMDGDGSIVKDRNGLICFRFSTSSKSLVESVKVLAYKLGIRYSVYVAPPRNWSRESYTVLFNSGDSVGIRDELVCFSPENVEKLNYWKTINVYVYRDNIPLSKAELKEVQDIVASQGNKDDIAYFKRQKIEDGYSRSMFHKYFNFINNRSVLTRIKQWNVHWDKVKLIDEPSRATVYDLLVPSSKVFAVNNGLIVYDTVSWIPILSDEANEECEKYYHSTSFYVNPDGRTTIGSDDLVSIVTYALTEEPKSNN